MWNFTSQVCVNIGRLLTMFVGANQTEVPCLKCGLACSLLWNATHSIFWLTEASVTIKKPNKPKQIYCKYKFNLGLGRGFPSGRLFASYITTLKILWQRTCQIFQTMKHSDMDYLRGIFKWHIRSTDSPRYFAFGLSEIGVQLNRGVAQSCWCQWHSVFGRLPAGARVAERARASFTQCVWQRARAWVRECTRVCSHSQLTAGRQWSFATQQTFDFLCVLLWRFTRQRLERSVPECARRAFPSSFIHILF